MKYTASDDEPTKEELAASKKILLKQFNTYVVDGLKPYGFQKVDKDTVSRATDNGLVEFISLINNIGHGRHTNFSLFIGVLVTSYLVEDYAAELSCCIGEFADTSDLWDSSTEAYTKEGFEEIINLVHEYVLPWFDELLDEEKAIAAFEYPLEKPTRNITGHSDRYLFLAGMLALRYGQIERAKQLMEIGRQEFKIPRAIAFGDMWMDLATNRTREEQLAHIAAAEKKTKEILKIKG